MLVPVVGFFYRRRLQKRTPDGLVALRRVFTTFCVAIVGYGIVLEFLYPSYGHTQRGPFGLAAGLLIAGAVAGLAGPRIERPLDCTDDRRLAGSYRTRFFLRIAFSEVAALFGFVAFFLTFYWWAYPIGAAIAAFGFRRAAPTAANLRHDQEILSYSGCGRSLVSALRHVNPPDRRS